jgi:protein tyrosine/serine phosphatase
MTPRVERPRRLEGVPNFRDLGGLPTEDGGLTRRGILYRSSGLEELTSRDVRHLIDDIGLSTVIDLRSPDDCEPAIPLQGTRVRVINLPIIRAGLSTDLERPMAPDGRVDVALIYRMFMEMSIPAITEIVRELTSGATPALFHCSAGKDRTGVVAAIILRAVGVTPDAVIADFVETETVLTEITAYMLRRPAYADVVLRLPPGTMDADPSFMSDFLDGVEDTYGGFPAWLEQHAGIPASTLATLEQILVEPGH